MKNHLLAKSLSFVIFFLPASLSHAAVIVSESMGSVAATTAIAAHSGSGGFDHDALAFSGSGDLRSTTVSTGYAGSSGGANAFLTGNGASTFLISGISTLGHLVGSVDLVFGAYKFTTASDMTTLDVSYSSNGTDWTSLAIPAQPTGAGTAEWRLISFTDTTIPIAGSLSLRWTNTDTTTSYRVDDIALTATTIPEPAVAWMGVAGLFGLLRRRRVPWTDTAC